MLAKINLIIFIFMLGAKVSIASINHKFEEIGQLKVLTSVLPYTSVSVSTSELSFEVLGMPGGYNSRDLVTLEVDSNQSVWSVYAKASSLVHSNPGIPNLPAHRLSFAINNSKQFTPLKDNVLFLKGVIEKETKPVTLTFRLTTTWQDTPGSYRGKITIAFLNNP